MTSSILIDPEAPLDWIKSYFHAKHVRYAA